MPSITLPVRRHAVLVWVLCVPALLYAGGHEDAYIQASDANNSDAFGGAVAISNDVAAVGAAGHNVFGPGSGAVYILRRTAGVWAEEQQLFPADGGSNDRFGLSVDIDGDVMIGGQPDDDDVVSQAGAAYVFRFDGTEWVEEQKVTAFDGATNRLFGTSSAVSGDTIAVADNPFATPNAIYVFVFDGTNWELEQKIDAPPGAEDFANSLDLDGDVIAAGSESGEAYLYRRQGTTWSLDDTLVASEPGAAFFGHRVSLSGDVVAVSDFGVAMYVFRYNGTNWVEETMEVAPAAGQFARDVAVDGDLAVPSGQIVYQALFNGADWNIQFNHYLASFGVGLGIGFGDEIALSGDQLIVGAPNDDTGGTNRGSVFIFTVTPDPDLRRGDMNDDGAVNIADAVFLLSFLFIPGSPVPPCEDAADSNDDGAMDISDAIYALSYLFVPGSPEPVAPGPLVCGPDETCDTLGCEASLCP